MDLQPLSLNIQSVRYFAVEGINKCLIVTYNNGEEMSVPLTETNFQYKEIMRQVEAGELTIQEAE